MVRLANFDGISGTDIVGQTIDYQGCSQALGKTFTTAPIWRESLIDTALQEEKNNNQPATEATVIKLLMMQPFLTKMDATLGTLPKCEYVLSIGWHEGATTHSVAGGQTTVSEHESHRQD